MLGDIWEKLRRNLSENWKKTWRNLGETWEKFGRKALNLMGWESEKPLNLTIERQLCQEKESRSKMKEWCWEKLGRNLGETWEKTVKNLAKLGRNFGEVSEKSAKSNEMRKRKVCQFDTIKTEIQLCQEKQCRSKMNEWCWQKLGRAWDNLGRNLRETWEKTSSLMGCESEKTVNLITERWLYQEKERRSKMSEWLMLAET